MPSMSTRRKLAIATWDRPREGNIYGRISLDTTEARRYLAWVRSHHGEKATLTHFVGACIGKVLRQTPSLNGRIWLGRYIPHETADLSFLVALEEGADLAKVKVERADEKGVVGIARELREQAERLHAGADDDFNKSKGTIRALPTWMLKPLVAGVGWLGSCGGLSIPALGVSAFPFGAAIITSIGMLGIDEGLVPPTPFAHVPVYVCLGAERDVPVAHEGKVVVRPQVVITATIDHRYIDGFQGASLARIMRALFANPWQLEGLAGPPADAEPATADGAQATADGAQATA